MWDRFAYSEIQRAKFSIVECRAIIDCHASLPENRSFFPRGDGAALRDSGIYWLYSTPETSWIFDRLNQGLAEYNQAYQFEGLQPITSGQLTRYQPGQRYDWHVDVGQGPMSLRKVSMVLQLSDPAMCEGGGLEVFNTDDPTFNNRLPLAQGDLAYFSSFMPHRATTVESGERWSLVLWVLGERPFR